MGRILLVLLACSLCSLLAQIIPPFRDLSVVRFTVFDRRGNPAPYEIRQFKLKNGVRPSAVTINGLEAKNVPQGEYEYELVRIGLRRPRVSAIRGTLATWKVEHLVTLVETGIYSVTSSGDEVIFDLQSPPFVLSGRVTGCREIARRKVWVRLMNQITGQHADVSVRKDGLFVVDNPMSGYNVLSAFDSSGYLCNSLVFVSSSRPSVSVECRCTEPNQTAAPRP